MPSFNSKFYEENGLLSDRIWKQDRREGASSDFPLIRLEKYYSLVKIHNNYYSYALKLKKEQETLSFMVINSRSIVPRGLFVPSVEFDFAAFDNFRKQYSELEGILFVNLQYDLGRLTSLSLSPLRMDYPRITRPLLYVLVYSGAYQVSGLSEESFGALIGIVKRNPNVYNNTNLINADSEYLKIISQNLNNDQYLQDLNRQKDNAALKVLTNLAKVNNEARETMEHLPKYSEFKKRIDNYELTAKELKLISKQIYRGKNTQKFLGYIDCQFRKEFEKLNELNNKLPPIPNFPLAQDKSESSMTGTFTVDAKGSGNSTANPK